MKRVPLRVARIVRTSVNPDRDCSSTRCSVCTGWRGFPVVLTVVNGFSFLFLRLV